MTYPEVKKSSDVYKYKKCLYVPFCTVFKKFLARCQWFMFVILLNREAEIGRTVVLGEPGKWFARPHLQNNQRKMD
jgi:hypothetical protein